MLHMKMLDTSAERPRDGAYVSMTWDMVTLNPVRPNQKH